MSKIVIKISSNLLQPDKKPDLIQKLASEISELRKNGDQFIIVTSGAVMHGVKYLGLERKPNELPMLQSCAAIGQITLMNRYQNVFAEYSMIPAQVLLSVDDFKIRSRYLNLRNMTESLLELNVIPVFNENDSVNTRELKFGDNDHLSSLITIMMNFDYLIILTDVDGFFDSDPKENPEAKLLERIENLDDDLLNLASDKVSPFSTGGMRKKIESAGRATKAGIEVFIGNGYKVHLKAILDHQERGTYIIPSAKKIPAFQKWIGFAPSESGTVFLDEGAFRALTRNHTSLLASGITGVEGVFPKGSLISVYYKDLKVAQGLTNYSSREINLIKGRKSKEFCEILKIPSIDFEEVIHKNNLYLIS